LNLAHFDPTPDGDGMQPQFLSSLSYPQIRSITFSHDEYRYNIAILSRQLLSTLVCVFLGVIANDGQLEVLPLEGVDQQDNVAY
jgi:hypothetical protein